MRLGRRTHCILRVLVPALELILVAVWFIFMRQFQGSKSPQRQYMADHLAEMKRHNELLEKLVAALIARGDGKP